MSAQARRASPCPAAGTRPKGLEARASPGGVGPLRCACADGVRAEQRLAAVSPACRRSRRLRRVLGVAVRTGAAGGLAIGGAGGAPVRAARAPGVGLCGAAARLERPRRGRPSAALGAAGLLDPRRAPLASPKRTFAGCAAAVQRLHSPKWWPRSETRSPQPRAVKCMAPAKAAALQRAGCGEVASEPRPQRPDGQAACARASHAAGRGGDSGGHEQGPRPPPPARVAIRPPRPLTVNLTSSAFVARMRFPERRGA